MRSPSDAIRALVDRLPEQELRRPGGRTHGNGSADPKLPNAEPAPMLPGAAKRAPARAIKANGTRHGNAPGFRQNGCGAPPKSSNPVSHGPRIMRELGVPEAAALKAHENCKMPPNINPAAAARFVTLPALRSRGLTSGHRSPRCSARPLGRHRCRYRKQNQCRRRLGIALRPRCPAQSRRSLRSRDKVSSRTSTVAPSLSMIETRKGLPHGNVNVPIWHPAGTGLPHRITQSSELELTAGRGVARNLLQKQAPGRSARAHALA